MTGTGSAPVATFSPTTLTFATQDLNTTSAAQTVTLTNTGTVSMSLSYIKTSGDFAQTNNCGVSLAINASCTINVTFTPTLSGARTGNLQVADNAAGSPQQISLTGTGAGTTAPAVSLSSSSLTFSSQQVNTTSSAQTVTVTNTGTASLSLTSISATGDYTQTNNCGSSLAAGANCAVNVSFKPTATGTRTGTLSIADNATGSPQQVSLTGSGVGAAVVSLSSTSLTFGSQQLNIISQPQTVTVTNTGNVSLSITSIATTGDFSQTNNCGNNLAAGASCAANVTFYPTASGTRTGTLSIADNASGSPQTVSLSGTGVVAGTLIPNTASLSFGTVNVGQSSTQTLRVSNTGGSAVTVSAVGTTGSGISVSGVSIPFNVAAGQSVSMNVTFAPNSASSVSGSVYLTNNSTSPNLTVAVSGTGASVQHQVAVQWSAPSPAVIGYYTYRSSVSGGPYTRLSSLDTTTNYVDQAVTAGYTYYYVVTSVDSNNVESAYSNEASATVPTP
ncbi:MAG TPA: choice-of-anchor D domain-containing protein [Terriglobales bacterium]